MCLLFGPIRGGLQFHEPGLPFGGPRVCHNARCLRFGNKVRSRNHELHHLLEGSNASKSWVCSPGDPNSPLDPKGRVYVLSY